MVLTFAAPTRDQLMSSPSKKQPERLAYSAREMADLIGVSKATAARMIRNKTISSIKVGSRRLIPAAEIQKLLAAAA
jgi:excisionase family DNA binding protein